MDQELSYSINSFIAETAERDMPGDEFELESSRMLEAKVSSMLWTKLGAMVAYRGDLKFKREGAFEGGLGKALTKMVSGEMTPLSKVEGSGIVYLADAGKEIQIIRLQGESLNVNGNDLLAFQTSVEYKITMHRKIAGMLAGGLFSVRLTGNGLIALTSHGKPLTLKVSPGKAVFTDPNATIAWSGNLTPELKTDIGFKSFIGRGGGESFQMKFEGDGFVVVQPYEEIPTMAGQAG